MKEPEWPKKFPYSNKMATYRRNLAILVAIGLVFDLALGFSWPLLILVLFGFIVWVVCLVFLGGRDVAAEAWPDHVRLRARWWPTLKAVRYGQILSLEKISDIALVVTYSSEGRTHKSSIPVRVVEDADQIETLLRMKTGLEVKHSNPWWLRLSRALGEEQRLEERGAWRHHFLHALRAVFVAMVVLTVAFACIIGFEILWPEAPAWLVILVATGLALTTYFLVFRRRRQKAK